MHEHFPNYGTVDPRYSRAKHDPYTQILIIDQLVLDFGFARFRINAIRINEGPLYIIMVFTELS